MFRLILARLGQHLFVLWAAVTLNFALPRLMPGNPLALLAGEDVASLTTIQREALMATVGLDRPWPEQYGRYLERLLVGDFGYSYQRNKPVIEILLSRLPWTLLLAGTGQILATLVGLGLGALAAQQAGRAGDMTLLGLAVFFESLPAFWVGMLLIAVLAVQVPLFPTFGAVSPWEREVGLALALDVAHHLALPLLTLVMVSFSGTFLVARSALLTVLGEPFVVAAHAKGLSKRQVLFRHVFRNALLPVVTVFALNLAHAFGGATVIETVFSYPGIGRLIYEAVLNRDYPVLQGAFFMITVIIIVANIAVDALYPWLDPRVRQAAMQAEGAA
ncbi:MAG: ABC transporter permease [Anaerolineales bacterium]|nr:ABC transporter permease [Anaerolineales bacterium]